MKKSELKLIIKEVIEGKSIKSIDFNSPLNKENIISMFLDGLIVDLVQTPEVQKLIGKKPFPKSIKELPPSAQHFIKNVLERFNMDPFENWGEFMAYCDGLSQHPKYRN